MHGSKEIIVVTPEAYKDLARVLAHNISKRPGCNGAFWTIKQYEENEFQLGGRRFVILIGAEDENPITKAYLSVIKNLRNEAGACFGVDGTRAVVFGIGHLEFTRQVRQLGLDKLSWNPLDWTTPFDLFPLEEMAEALKLRPSQTKTATTLFLAEHFDDWVGPKKSE